jgi:hypothetical protein
MLGDISSRFEASNNVGAINPNDGPHGEGSYGLFQFYSGAGVVQAFIKWMATISEYKPLAAKFDGLTAPTAAFNATWKFVASSDIALFGQAQRDYAKMQYYQPAVAELLKVGFDATKYSEAMQDVILSNAILFSPGNVPALFENAIGATKTAGFDPTKEEFLLAYLYHIRANAAFIKNDARLIWRAMEEYAMVRGEIK